MACEDDKDGVRQALLLPLLIEDAGGEAGKVTIEVKAWAFEGAPGSGALAVTWEFRRFVDAAGLCPESLYLHQWIRKRRDVWAPCWRRFGIEPGEALIPSRRSAQQSRVGDDTLCADGKVRSEWSITTVGLLVLLMHISSDARSQKAKRMALGLLAAWLTVLVKAEESARLRSMVVGSSHLSSCQVFADSSGVCCHVQDIYRLVGMPEGRPSFVGEALASCLVKLYAGGMTCRAFQHIMSDILPILATGMHLALLEKGHSDLRRAALYDPSRAKRRRCDEDLQASVMQRSASCSQSAGNILAIDGSSRRSGTNWMEKMVCSFQSSAWLHFKGAPAVNLVMDAKRIGNPAEDTEVLLATNCGSLRSTWLPPQVGHTLRGSLCRKPIPRLHEADGGAGAARNGAEGPSGWLWALRPGWGGPRHTSANFFLRAQSAP